MCIPLCRARSPYGVLAQCDAVLHHHNSSPSLRQDEPASIDRRNEKNYCAVTKKCERPSGGKGGRRRRKTKSSSQDLRNSKNAHFYLHAPIILPSLPFQSLNFAVSARFGKCVIMNNGRRSRFAPPLRGFVWGLQRGVRGGGCGWMPRPIACEKQAFSTSSLISPRLSLCATETHGRYSSRCDTHCNWPDLVGWPLVFGFVACF